MSIEDTKVIDFIGTEQDGAVVLTISDHLEWEDTHIALLQEKINSYLAFIESGEIYETYPAGKDSEIKINVVFKHEPTDEGVTFLSQCKEIINQAGFKFSYETGI